MGCLLTIPVPVYGIATLFIAEKFFNMGAFDPFGLLILLSSLMLISGIVCAHIAASRIKRSGGDWNWKWMARTAYVMGYGWLLWLLTVLVFSFTGY